MKLALGANQKTTIAGIIAGSIPILEQAYFLMKNGTHVDWGVVAMGIAIMALGVLAKDWNTTGGTNPSVPIPAGTVPVISYASMVAPEVVPPTIANPTGVITVVQPTTANVVADKQEVKPWRP